VATLLLERAMEEGRRRGAAMVRFFTAVENTPMHQLAPRLGFHIESTHLYLAAPPTPLRSSALEAAVSADLEALWDLVRLDPAFQEGGRTYCRGWRAIELTREQFGAHLAEGQVLVARHA